MLIFHCSNCYVLSVSSWPPEWNTALPAALHHPAATGILWGADFRWGHAIHQSPLLASYFVQSISHRDSYYLAFHFHLTSTFALSGTLASLVILGNTKAWCPYVGVRDPAFACPWAPFFQMSPCLSTSLPLVLFSQSHLFWEAFPAHSIKSSS